MISISVDVEEDISLYLTNSRWGLEEGLPRLIDLFHSLGVAADLFVQGNLILSMENLLREAAGRGHHVGLHGARHRGTWLHPTVEEKGLREAAMLLAEVTGTTPKSHRTPNFRLKERHLPILERTGLLLDSSILPNARHVRFRGQILVRSYEGAPRMPYHPSRKDVVLPGGSQILEVPVTENPDFPRAPLGLGYLNTFGLTATEQAFAKVREPYATFLMHTWEASELGAHYGHLPGYVKRECSSNQEPLSQLLGSFQDSYHFATLEEIGQSLHPPPGAP